MTPFINCSRFIWALNITHIKHGGDAALLLSGKLDFSSACGQPGWLGGTECLVVADKVLRYSNGVFGLHLDILVKYFVLLQAPVMVEDCEGCKVFSSLSFNHREGVSAIGRVARRVVPDPKGGSFNLCTSFNLIN